MNDAALYGMLYVLAASLAGAGFAAAIHFRNERGSSIMALYEVRRTDAVGPGEFDNALVIAAGTALAREAVAHLLPEGAKVDALRVDTNAKNYVGPYVLSTYFDENEPETAPDDTIPLF